MRSLIYHDGIARMGRFDDGRQAALGLFVDLRDQVVGFGFVRYIQRPARRVLLEDIRGYAGQGGLNRSCFE